MAASITISSANPKTLEQPPQHQAMFVIPWSQTALEIISQAGCLVSVAGATNEALQGNRMRTGVALGATGICIAALWQLRKYERREAERHARNLFLSERNFMREQNEMILKLKNCLETAITHDDVPVAAHTYEIGFIANVLKEEIELLYQQRQFSQDQITNICSLVNQRKREQELLQAEVTGLKKQVTDLEKSIQDATEKRDTLSGLVNTLLNR